MSHRHFTHFHVAPPLDAVSIMPRLNPTSPTQTTAARQAQPRPHNPRLAPNPTSAPQSTAERQSNPCRHNPRRAPALTSPMQSTTARQAQPRHHNSQPRAKPNFAETIHSCVPKFSLSNTKKMDPPHPRNRGSPIKSSRAAVCKSTPNPIRLNYLRFHTGGTAETPITPIR